MSKCSHALGKMGASRSTPPTKICPIVIRFLRTSENVTCTGGIGGPPAGIFYHRWQSASRRWLRKVTYLGYDVPGEDHRWNAHRIAAISTPSVPRYRKRGTRTSGCNARAQRASIVCRHTTVSCRYARAAGDGGHSRRRRGMKNEGFAEVARRRRSIKT